MYSIIMVLHTSELVTIEAPRSKSSSRTHHRSRYDFQAYIQESTDALASPGHFVVTRKTSSKLREGYAELP